MDYIAKFLEQHKDMAEIIHNKLEEQRCCLDPPNNKERKFLASIYSITDTNTLNALIERAQEIRNQAEDERKQVMADKNRLLITNYANFKSKRECDLLDTLHRVIISYGYEYGEIHGGFTLNNNLCVFEARCDYRSKLKKCCIVSIHLNSTCVWKNMPDNIISNFAFQSAMTCVEFATFLDKVVLALVQNCFVCCRDLYVPHYIPVVNIANLLLCAMNEQEQNDATLTCSTMSLVERVLYDVFLLKCITEKS